MRKSKLDSILITVSNRAYLKLVLYKTYLMYWVTNSAGWVNNPSNESRAHWNMWNNKNLVNVIKTCLLTVATDLRGRRNVYGWLIKWDKAFVFTLKRLTPQPFILLSIFLHCFFLKGIPFHFPKFRPYLTGLPQCTKQTSYLSHVDFLNHIQIFSHSPKLCLIFIAFILLLKQLIYFFSDLYQWKCSLIIGEFFHAPRLILGLW